MECNTGKRALREEGVWNILVSISAVRPNPIWHTGFTHLPGLSFEEAQRTVLCGYASLSIHHPLYLEGS